MSHAGDPDQVWHEFWAPIVMKGDQLDVEQVKLELFDYHTLLTEAKKVYMYITGGRLSKPNTAAFHIIAAHDEAVKNAYDEGVRDGQEQVAPT